MTTWQRRTAGTVFSDVGHALVRRELRIDSGRALEERTVLDRYRNLRPARDCNGLRVRSTLGITHMEVDRIEGRYMLASTACGAVAAFDLHKCSQSMTRRAAGGQVSPEWRIKKAHQKRVTTVKWYAWDTGMFFSSSFDQSVNVWDTRRLESVVQFRIDEMVTGIDVPATSITHSLVACCSRRSRIVRLFDPASGGGAHVIQAHRGGCAAVAWCPGHEFTLCSGGQDGAIRFWDIRRPGALLCLDETNSTKSGEQSTAHSACVTALHFLTDGLHLVSAGADKRVKLWDVISGKNTLRDFDLGARRLEFNRFSKLSSSADSRILAVPVGSGVFLFDTLTNERLTDLEGHFDAVHAAPFNPHIQEVYTGGGDAGIQVWKPSSELELAVVAEATEPATRDLAMEVEDDEDQWSD